MKRHSQLLKVISILLINILLIQISGCYSTKVISNSDLPDLSEYNCVIHYQDSKYSLDNAVLSNGVLSGKIDVENKSPNRNKIHVYLLSETVLTIYTGMLFSIPADKIVKVETVKFALGKTISLAAVGSIGLFLILYAAMWDGGFGGF